MFDFPDVPTANQTISTPEGVQYIWTGSKWSLVVASGLDQATADTLYVNVAGDSMTGTLGIDTGVLNLGGAAAPNTANITAGAASMIYLSKGVAGHYFWGSGETASVVPYAIINASGIVSDKGYFHGVGSLGSVPVGGGPFLFMDQDQTIFELGGGLTGGVGGTTDATAFRWRGYQMQDLMTLSSAIGLSTTQLKLYGWQYLDMSAVAADSVLVFNRQAGRRATIQSQTLGVTRWIMNLGDPTPETGAGAGSNFLLVGCDDVGTANINVALEIERITNAASFGGTLTVNSGVLNLAAVATVGTPTVPGIYATPGSLQIFSPLVGIYFSEVGTGVDWAWINEGGLMNATGIYHGITSLGSPTTGGGPLIFMDADQSIFALGGGTIAGGTTDATAFRWRTHGMTELATLDNLGNLKASGTLQLSMGTSTYTTLTAAGGFTVLAGPDGFSTILCSNGLWAQNSYRSTTHYINAADGVASFAQMNALGTFNVSGVWGVISEASQKQNIAPYTAGLEAVRGLNPVTFQYIAGSPFFRGDVGSGPQIGLIAEDVAPLLPELVGELAVPTDVEGVTQTVTTLTPGNTIYAMINAIKEIADRLDALEAAGGVVRAAATPAPAAPARPAQRPAPPPQRPAPAPRRR